MLRATRLLALAAAGAVLAGAPALAQSGGCQDGAKYMQARLGILEQLKSVVGKGKKVDPRQTCPLFTKMVANGEAGTKWLASNKDWCQVPAPMVEGFTNEFAQMQKLKAAHCSAAVKFAQMEKQAREQQDKGGGPDPLRRGGGLTDDWKVPKGAL